MAVLIKRYANRKLYNTQTSRYITLKGIADLLEAGEDVRVIDNESGEDITSITLSQILVDTERSNRAVPGSLLSGLFQRGGDALYEALSRGVDDASERLEDFQRTMRRLLRVRHDGEGLARRGRREKARRRPRPRLDRLHAPRPRPARAARHRARAEDARPPDARRHRRAERAPRPPDRGPRRTRAAARRLRRRGAGAEAVAESDPD